MHALFEITAKTDHEVTIECSAIRATITIEPDGTWTAGQDKASQMERDGYDMAEWAQFSTSHVGAVACFLIATGLDERFEGLTGLVSAEDVDRLTQLQAALNDDDDDTDAANAHNEMMNARHDGDPDCGWRHVLQSWSENA